MSTLNNKTKEGMPTVVSAAGRRLGGICMRWIAGLAALMAFHVQADAVNLTGINFSNQEGGVFEIRLGFDGAPPEPKGFTIEQPARISLDLDGVTSKLAHRKHTVDAGNARSVYVAEADGKTRVVVNLIELTGYETRAEGNTLVVSIGNDSKRQFLTQPKQTMGGAFVDKSQAESSAAIADIDFQRGDKGEGQLIISLSDPKVDIDVVSEGSLIKVKFMQVNLPENLQRRFDVNDFATPVQMFDATMADGSAVISIKPSTPDYDYLAYQTDGTYVVSLKPLTPEEIENKNAAFAYVGEKISLNFQDIEVRSVLQIVADFTGLNLVASDTVGGKITLRLDEVPWDQALELILKTKGLDKRQVGNVLMVAPATEIAERERQEIETRKQLQELAPLQTEYIRIKYAQADQIFKLFESSGGKKRDKDSSGSTGSLLTARGEVVVDSRTNALLITETAERLEAIRRLINLIDVPIRQVMIEARIVVANSDYLEDMGIRWGGAVINTRGDDAYAYSGRSSSVTSMLSDVSAGDPVEVEFPSSYMVDLAASQESATRFAVGYLSDNYFVTAEISALESQGRGEVMSQPKVITGDKQTAVIKSGQEIPYQTSSSSGRTTVQFKEAVLKLEVTPSITPDGRIVLDLELNQDSVAGTITGEFGAEIPFLDTNSIVTQVLVDNGQTIVLGGVYQTREVENEVKTPILGDIPYLGRFFRKNFKDYQKQELLMFITPRILADSLLD
ncbi:MAG TPA: type IV pilus secretin PilQ [Pseudomonadales bacterium]